MTQDPDEVTPHEETREFRYFGPPGTGKTTTLSRQIRRAVDKYGSSSVLVTSFSRAAAAELVSRGLPVDREKIGTLHAVCWRAMGRPEIAEAHVEEWNRKYPMRALGGTKVSAEDRTGDEQSGSHPGDEVFARINMLRGQLRSPETWSELDRKFFSHWQEYKRENDLMDFTDLIETALRSFSFAPGRPSVIFADEAQDLSPLQLALIRQWGKRAEFFITSGDDDQLIYDFCGCTPRALLTPALPDYAIRVLDQSYRVPAAVHEGAMRWISRLPRRQLKVWKPRGEQGVLARIPYCFRQGDSLVERIVLPEAEAGRSVMLLASCAYMLAPVIAALRKAAVPFHNPYRANNGLWNPVSRAPGGTAARVLALMSVRVQRWTMRDLALVTEWMDTETCVHRGAKTAFARMSKQDLARPAGPHDLARAFQPDVLDRLINCIGSTPEELTEWWRKGILATRRKRTDYPVALALAGRLTQEPKVIVGTIHSVKGGQADTVIVCPDLSAEGAAGGDPVRLMYVAMTRARQKLLLAPPGHSGSCSGIFLEASDQM